MKAIAFLMLLAVAAAGPSGGRDDLVRRLESKISVARRGWNLLGAIARVRALTGLELRVVSQTPRVQREIEVRLWPHCLFENFFYLRTSAATIEVEIAALAAYSIER